MQLPISINQGADTPLQQQLARELRRMILDGTLLPGTKVPSSRSLSGQLGVARNTVVLAYDRLISEGFLESRVAKATYVCTHLPTSDLTNLPLQKESRLDPAKDLDRSAVCEMVLNLFSSEGTRLPLDFRIGRPDHSLFPIAIWRRLLLETLGGLKHALFEYADPAGHAFLREALRSHLRVARGMKVDVEQVIIVAGCQQGFGMTGRLLDIYGKDIVIENPCYRGAEFAFKYLGSNLIPVPVDRDGIETDLLPRSGARLVYVTPSHQFPLGHTMSIARRQKLLAWAEETGTYILEDDYDSDFRYHSSPLAALHAMDCAERVIYLGTFSKSIGPNLRLGYMVVPKHLVRAAHATKAIMDNGHPWLEQVVAGEFIRSGSFENHLTKVRKKYLDRRNLVMESIQAAFGPSEFNGIDGGMHLTWTLPEHVKCSAYEFQQKAKSLGVGVYSLRESPALQSRPFPGDDRIVLLGYSGLQEDGIEAAINKLSRLGGHSIRQPHHNPSNQDYEFATTQPHPQ
jgi:GntR family transcriptional regulator/MocR family aminotransferase